MKSSEAAGMGIQNGAVTHHHDQSMTWQSLSTTKATPSSPTIKPPVPLPLLPSVMASSFAQTARALDGFLLTFDRTEFVR